MQIFAWHTFVIKIRKLLVPVRASDSFVTVHPSYVFLIAEMQRMKTSQTFRQVQGTPNSKWKLFPACDKRRYMRKLCWNKRELYHANLFKISSNSRHLSGHLTPPLHPRHRPRRHLDRHHRCQRELLEDYIQYTQ